MPSAKRPAADPNVVFKYQDIINNFLGHNLPPGPAFIPHYVRCDYSAL